MAFRTALASCAALLAFASTPIRLGAQSCTFTTIDHPNSFANAATGITKHGLIAGEYLDRNTSRNHGYVFEDGEFTDVDVPGARETQVRGINNHGTIAGTYMASDYSVHAFVLNGDELTSIDFPDAGQTYGSGINDRGEVVGFAKGHGYLWRDGEFATIDFPGARNTTSMAIASLLWRSTPSGYKFVQRPRDYFRVADHPPRTSHKPVYGQRPDRRRLGTRSQVGVPRLTFESTASGSQLRFLRLGARGIFDHSKISVVRRPGSQTLHIK